MNLQQLEYVIAVDRFKNFSRAADHCSVTQATLSAMVRKLEEELNVVIFDRKASPIFTTDIGQAVIDEGKIILAHVEQIREKTRRVHANIEGKIRIGVIPTVVNSLLPRIITPMLDDFPKLNVEIHEITTNGIIRQLREGTIDVGILATPVAEESIEEEILYYEALMVYGEMNSRTRYLLPDEIRNHKVWLLEKGHCLRDQFVNICGLKRKDLLPDNLSFEANSFDTLLNMVDRFGGLTLIPELYYQDLPKERKKKVHAFRGPVPVREVTLVYYRPFAKQRMVKVLVDMIRKNVIPSLQTRKLKKSDQVIARV